ncbi:DUF4352 domain-containing protein [Gracilibacillus alcaliphilus]|uniref:DUF4352 domain-containing protein n=1 Tax=Gracilibacillus alcaliphilus TaxID=1401441 RepID=UPI001957D52F|nr:DUF4352 domain-containing protein [Gracilibacillus alcaliphilus]MBM7675764.1 major membrane immunogen (membrane-anchored lipoprotein) [Gracilibacillus alcaliphilus]
MKKLLLTVLFTSLLLAACGSDDTGETTDSGGEENMENTTENSGEEEKEVYSIGDTAVITSDLYEFDYQVTVNDFYFADEVNGKTIEDVMTSRDDDYTLAVVDVTIKNISDESYIPHQMFSANLSGIDEQGGDTSYDEFFPEGDEELAPGEEVQGHVVYIEMKDYHDEFAFKYEVMSDQEVIFELPHPEQ